MGERSVFTDVNDVYTAIRSLRSHQGFSKVQPPLAARSRLQEWHTRYNNIHARVPFPPRHFGVAEPARFEPAAAVAPSRDETGPPNPCLGCKRYGELFDMKCEIRLAVLIRSDVGRWCSFRDVHAVAAAKYRRMCDKQSGCMVAATHRYFDLLMSTLLESNTSRVY